ncbi:MAG TPA: cytochrome P450 [Candidatus Caenarcaniphilales bacterium]
MKLPDGPQTPSFLQLLQWIARPLELMETCAQRYGDIFTLHLGAYSPIVFISNPQAIQEIFTAHPEQFDVGQANRILQPLVGEKSLLMLDSDRHQRQRRLLMPPFHGDRMRAYSKLICDITLAVIDQWKLDEPFAVRSSMQEISLRVILQAVFGLNEGQRFQQLNQLLRAILDVTGSPLSSSLLFFKILQKDLGAWSPWGRFVRQKQQIEQLLNREIQERRDQADFSGSDILTLLMSARDEQGQPLTDTELRDELMTLLVAGHETTASALTWALYWIHHLPEVHERLLKELDTVGDGADLSAVARLPYLTAVCSETLRIYPVGMLAFARIVKSPLQLMGYDFEPGTMLAPCIYLTHQREELYPEPKRFNPERFLERHYSPYEYLPFGGGNRRCIGMAFAQFEMKLVLATILSRWHLAIAGSRPVKPVRRGVTLAPASGRWLVVTESASATTNRCSSRTLAQLKNIS